MFRGLDTFYQSKEWRQLLYNIKTERIQKTGQLVCECCGKSIIKDYECIGHHKIELNKDNVFDYNISLNPDNIELLCLKCHNKKHKRFCKNDKTIYLVYGSPLSGKSSYVKNNAEDLDLVIDIDKIWQMISINEPYVKPKRLAYVMFSVRDYLIDRLKTRNFPANAWLIGGYPTLGEREEMINELGCETIFINTDKEECMRRLEREPEGRDIELWSGYIDDWWNSFEEDPPMSY